MSFDWKREWRDSEGYLIWSDGMSAENFLRGIQLGMETRQSFVHHENVYGPCEGFVYFIAIGDPYITHVKIGFTRANPYARLSDLQTGCPFPMRMLGFILGCMAQERELHNVLGDYRAQGEWFSFSDYVERTVRGLLESETVE